MRVHLRVVLEATHFDMFGQVIELDESVEVTAFEKDMDFIRKDKLTIRVKQIPKAEILPPHVTTY